MVKNDYVFKLICVFVLYFLFNALRKPIDTEYPPESKKDFIAYDGFEADEPDYVYSVYKANPANKGSQ